MPQLLKFWCKGVLVRAPKRDPRQLQKSTRFKNWGSILEAPKARWRQTSILYYTNDFFMQSKDAATRVTKTPSAVDP